MRRAASYFCAFAFVAVTTAGAVIACSSSPPNPHDDVINDTTPPSTTSAAVDAAPSGFPIMLDGGYYDAQPYNVEVPDGYAPLSTCSACDCQLDPTSGGDARTDAPEAGPPGYCIGGLPGDITPPATCAVTGSALALGCNAVPAACAGLAPKEACPCLLLNVDYGCFANCAVQGKNVVVYCPDP